MKLIIMKSDRVIKLSILILLLASFEVISVTNKSTYEVQKLKVN